MECSDQEMSFRPAKSKQDDGTDTVNSHINGNKPLSTCHNLQKLKTDQGFWNMGS